MTLTIDSGRLAVPPPNETGITVFKGIPYAAPPVAALRFCPPQPCAPWAGSRPVDAFGANSLQGMVFADIDPFAVGVSEDCLYVNVWTGAELGKNEKRPVLFWIHGGGFVVGSGSEPRYDGSNLAARGIVVVTINHRLNALGYLAHPELSSERGSSGNYAMLDLVAALQWVKRNITAFGGDPDAVTIAGESAGSMAASILMCSPLAKGLFARVIGQSGGLLATPAEPLMSRAVAEENGLRFAALLGAKTAADLRSVPAAAILKAAPKLGYRPIIDGYFLPRHPRDIMASGVHHDVPMLAGWNKDEGFNFNILKWGDGIKSTADWLDIYFPGKLSEAAKHYPADITQSARDLGGDLVINHGTWVWIEMHKRFGTSDIYRYCFDQAPETPPGWLARGENKDAGAFHSCEIPYVFDNLTAFPWRITEADRRTASQVANLWVNFIKSGNPNGRDLPNWPPYRSSLGPCLRLGVKSNVEYDIDGERHRFLAAALASYPSAMT